jgi:hypothetical protein
MKLTKNRQVILQLLADSDRTDYPPYSVSSLMYMLDNVITYNWEGYEKYQLDKVPSKQQMHRTIRDLWLEGLIVGSKSIEDSIGQGLPSRVINYQLSEDVNKNYITSECESIYRKVNKAKYGVSLFGQSFDWGLAVDEVTLLTRKVKAMLHKTHPDKQKGFVEQFNQMTQCMEWIRAGIPLPTDPNNTITGQTIEQHLSQ